jgi:hypothetical protein
MDGEVDEVDVLCRLCQLTFGEARKPKASATLFSHFSQ